MNRGLTKGEQLSNNGIRSVLDEIIRNSGLREVNHDNQFKRQTVPMLHGFRKFYSSQLVEADLKTELRWLLEGHNLKGNDMSYVRTTEKRLRQEYEKAIDALTIDQANILQRKVETLQVEKSLLDNIASRLKELEEKSH